MKGFVFAALRTSRQCKRGLLSVALVGAISALLPVRSAQADAPCANCPAGSTSWVFRPSYYSHDPASTVRIGRQYSHGPVFYRPQGEYIKSGYNYIRSGIQVGGQTFEQVNQWDSWYQVGGQF